MEISKLIEEGLDMWLGATYSLEAMKVGLEFSHNNIFMHKSLIPIITYGFGSLLPEADDYILDQGRTVYYEDEFL